MKDILCMGVKKVAYILLVLCSLVFGSCIREELAPCPPLKVMFDVKDKNYFNVDAVERLTGLAYRVDENKPFREYIQTLFYVMYNAETGEEVLTRHLHDVEGDASMATGEIPGDLPFGKYVLVVWGNILDERPILADKNYCMYDLHLGEVEGFDTYMTSDTLLYDASHNSYVVDLERVKGKLLVQVSGLPEAIGYADKRVTGVASYVTDRFDYKETTSVHKSTEWEPDSKSMETVLSPSLKAYGSLVSLRLYDDPALSAPAIFAPDASVTMARNTLTVLRYVYNGREFEVFILINDNWERLHSMDID